jgi:hypothetical protein
MLFFVLCLIVVPLPPGENSFAVKINNKIRWFDEKITMNKSQKSILSLCLTNLLKPLGTTVKLQI